MIRLFLLAPFALMVLASTALADGAAPIDPNSAGAKACASYGLQAGTDDFNTCASAMNDAANADAAAGTDGGGADPAQLRASMQKQMDAMKAKMQNDMDAAKVTPGSNCVTTTNGTNTSTSCN